MLQGAVLLFDEAHNIEGCARDAGSVDILLNDIEDARNWAACAVAKGESFAPLLPMHNTLQGLASWLHHISAGPAPKEEDGKLPLKCLSGGEVCPHFASILTPGGQTLAKTS